MHFIKKFHIIPISILATLVIALGVINYEPGAYLTGWDNLHPELDPWMNLKRAIFTTWQEYQGLGLLGGMGHGADLIRQLFLIAISPFMPTSFIRYFYTLLTLFIGSAGTYYLANKVINIYSSKKIYSSSEATAESRSNNETINQYSNFHTILPSLVAAVFYMLNLATIQQYYIAFETFTAHFASLPWILLGTINYLTRPERKNLLLLALVFLLATPAAYVPTLFVVTLIAVGIITVFLAFDKTPSTVIARSEATKQSRLPRTFTLSLSKGNDNIMLGLKKIAAIGLVIFITNAFWLLPFAYFTLTSAHVNVEAKINQMATDNIFLMNKEFGNPQNVALLKGLWFNSVEPDLSSSFSLLMKPWRDYIENPLVQFIGYSLFAGVLAGAALAIRRKSPILTGFVVLAAVSVLLLLTQTQPFATVNMILREYIPLFNQVFRFSFTKFSLLAGLTYALLLGITTYALSEKLSQMISNKNLSTRYPLRATPYALCILLIIIFSFPAFKGHLFFEKELRVIPKEYFDLFAYFKSQDKNTRIANFPQPSFWSWNYYSWGYDGSGFLWYGIEQPILDRAFDVWSRTNENYYLELQQALYAEDTKRFEQVLNKYQVSWLLVDKNIIYPQSPKALFYKELEDMIEKTPSIKKDKTFGNIVLYKVTLKDTPVNFVYTTGALPSVNSAKWTNADPAYTTLGTYKNTNDPSTIFPFRSLQSLKLQENNEFTLLEKDNTIVLKAKIQGTKEQKLTIPAYTKTEKIMPVEFYTRKIDDTSLGVYMNVKTPEIFINDKKVWGKKREQELHIIKASPNTPLSKTSLNMNVNGVTNIKVTAEEKNYGVSMLSFVQDNIIVITDSANTNKTVVVPKTFGQALALEKDEEIALPANASIELVMPKINDNYFSANFDLTKSELKNCEQFRRGTVESTPLPIGRTLVAENATACLAYYTPFLPHNEGYAVFITSEHTTGKPLHFWLLNSNQSYAVIDTYLTEEKSKRTNAFILSPQEDFGEGYSLHFDSISIGKDRTENAIYEAEMYHIPYNLITNMRIKTSTQDIQTAKSKNITVTHPNYSLYKVALQNDKPTTLILSQSYDPGWQAYTIGNEFQISNLKFKIASVLPFIFGKKVPDHFMVNNWSNGWTVTTPNANVILVYLPQYLQYIGFLILIGGAIYASYTALTRKKTH
jgi:hypothetical protein